MDTAPAAAPSSRSISRSAAFRATLVAIALFTAATIALLPFAREHGPEMPGFNAAFGTGLMVAELATSFLLLALLRQTLRPSVLLLANAYLYSGLMALAYVLTCTDALVPGRPLIGGPQTVPWLYNSWIVGFASLAGAAVLQEMTGGGTAMTRSEARRSAAASSAVVLAIVIGLVAVAATMAERLPPLMDEHSWTPLNAAFNYGGVIVLFASALGILVRMRPRSDLFLWLSLALAVIALGNMLAAFGGGRFTVGWYACRLGWAASSAVLLFYFLGQFVRQHGQLIRAAGDLEERTRERDRIWNVSEDLLGVSTFDGRFIALNPAWTRMLGWSEEEILGNHVDRLRHADDAARARAARERLAAGVPTVRLENRFRHKDGSWRWIAWTMTVDQGLIYVAGRDVTAEKDAQETLRKSEADAAYRQKMEALGQLTGGVAHDFNNLLMIVSGYVPRLKRSTAADERARAAIQAIEIATQRGASLTRQLLSFSRRQPVNPMPVDTGERIAALRPLLDGTVGPLIELRLALADGLWPVTVDTNEFELALLNLVLNARDAVKQDGIITLSANNVTLTGDETPERLAGAFVAVAVTDTGHGIPADILPKVFDPFFTTKQTGKGTGLGLSQVHGFTHQSGGTALIASAPGTGTVVTLYLPRSQARPEVAAPEGLPALATGTALLVEDNTDVAEVGREMLEQLGYRVQVAANGPQALTLFEARSFDLMVSDVVMPGGMNGVELARTIHARRPELPILLVTGYTGSADLAPEFPVLRKPYRFEQLRRAVADVTDPARQRVA